MNISDHLEKWVMSLHLPPEIKRVRFEVEYHPDSPFSEIGITGVMTRMGSPKPINVTEYTKESPQ